MNAYLLVIFAHIASPTGVNTTQVHKELVSGSVAACHARAVKAKAEVAAREGYQFGYMHTCTEQTKA